MSASPSAPLAPPSAPEAFPADLPLPHCTDPLAPAFGIVRGIVLGACMWLVLAMATLAAAIHLAHWL